MPTEQARNAEVRYGVFLRPDPRTCAAVTRITDQLRAQYGFVSAGAFPPHATLVGSLPLARPVADLIETLDGVLAPIGPFEIENSGVTVMGRVIVYDVHSIDHRPNGALLDLAARVDTAVRTLLAEPPTGSLPADVRTADRWHGHLSLASHDLYGREELRAEVLDYVNGLGVPCPPRFTAEVVALYRFEHSTWTGQWWHDLTWSHVRSWQLG